MTSVARSVASGIVKPFNRSFSLRDLGSKLRLDFDAADVVKNSDGFVTSVRDSVNGISLEHQGVSSVSQFTGSHGSPALLIPSGNWFQVTGNDIVADDNDGEMFVVYRCTDPSNTTNCVFSIGAGNTTTRHLSLLVRAGSSVDNQSNVVHKAYNSTSGRNFNTFFFRSRCWNIFSTGTDGTTGFLRRRAQEVPASTQNGFASWFSDIEDAPQFRADDIALGSRVSSSSQQNRYIGEWSKAIVTRHLTSDERSDVIRYLQARYPVRHFFVVGDSISNDSTDWAGNFISKSEARNKPYHINTYAAGGASISAIKTQVDTNVIGNDYDDLFLLGGINSIAADASADSIFAVIKQIQQSIIIEGKRIIIMTLLPFKGSSSWTADRQVQFDLLNDKIRSLQGQVATTVIDTHAALLDPATPQTMLPAYTADFLHPNTTGSSVLADFTVQRVK